MLAQLAVTFGSVALLQKRTLKTSEMKIILNWKLAAASQEQARKKSDVQQGLPEKETKISDK